MDELEERNSRERREWIEREQKERLKNRRFLTSADLVKANPADVVDIAHWIADELSSKIDELLWEEGITGSTLNKASPIHRAEAMGKFYQQIGEWYDKLFPGRRYYIRIKPRKGKKPKKPKKPSRTKKPAKQCKLSSCNCECHEMGIYCIGCNR